MAAETDPVRSRCAAAAAGRESTVVGPRPPGAAAAATGTAAAAGVDVTETASRPRFHGTAVALPPKRKKKTWTAAWS